MTVIHTYREKLASHSHILIVLIVGLLSYSIASLLELSFPSIETFLLTSFVMAIIIWQGIQYAKQHAQQIAIDLLNQLGQGVTIANHKRQFMYVNPAFAQILNTTPDALIGKNPLEITPKNQHSLLIDAHQRRKQGESDSYELCLLTAQGEEKRVLMAATPIQQRGTFFGTLAVITDLMPLREAKRALEMREKHYRNLVEFSPDLIAIHAQGKVRFINQAGAKMLGAESPEQLIGEPIAQFIKPEYLPIMMTRVKKIMETGEILAPYEEIFTRLDGTDLHLEVIGIPFDDNGVKSVQIIARDITQRKQMERDLIQQNTFLTQMMDALGQGVILTGQGGEIKMVNPAYATMLGYSQRELLGKTITELTIDSDRHVVESAYLQRKANLMTVSEARLRRKDGNTVPVLMTATPRIEDESVIGAFIITTDLTQQKAVEESLRQSEIEKTALLDALPDLIFILNNEGIFVDYVAPLDRLYMPPEQFLNKPISEILPEAVATEIVTALQKAIATGETQIAEYELSRPNEDARYFEARLLAYDDKHVIDVVREITDRKRAELAQQEQETQYRKLFENSTDAIYLVYENKLILVNQKFTELTGVTQADVEAENIDIAEIIAPVSRDLVQGRRKKLTSGYISSTRFEFVARHIDGREFEIEVSINTIPYKGGIATQGIARDISQRKQAENALRSSEKRYRNVVEHSTEGIFVTVDNIVKYANPTFVKMLGAEEKSQVIGMDNMQFLHEDFHEIVKSRQAQLLEQHQSVPILHEQYIRLDGSILDVEVSATPIDYDGAQGIQVIVHDLTLRKQAEKILRENAIAFQEQLKTLNTVGVELAKAETLDELYRLIVELGRKRFNFDRMAFWLIDDQDPSYVWGTYGTDEDGNLRDESKMRYPITSWNIAVNDPLETQPIYLKTNAELFDKREVIGTGWHATIVIRDGDKAVGWLDVDNLFSQRPLSPYELELLVLYGSTIGALYKGKKAQDALKIANTELIASQAALKNLIEQIPIGIQIFDKDGLCIDVNQAHLDIFGVSDRTQLVDKYNIFQDELALDVGTYEGIQHALDGKVVNLGEREFDFSHAIEGFADKELTYKVLNVTFFPVIDDNGDIIRIVALNDDRTESKLAEQQLRRSESNLKAIFNSVAETLILIDLEGNIQARNRIRGVNYDTGGDLTPQQNNFRDTLVPELQPLFDSHMQKVKQGKTVHLEREHNNRWFDIYYTPVYDDEVVTGACISSTEITERKEAEQALLKSEAQFRAVFEGSNIGIAIANTKGYIISCNHAFEEMVGYSEDELQSIYFSDITHKDDIGKSMTLFNQLEAGEIDYYSYEKRYIHKDGNIIWANLNVSLFPVRGVADELTIAMVEDITQRRQTEAQLLTSESTLKTIFNSVDEALVMMDKQGVIQTYNNSAHTLFKKVTGKQIEIGVPMTDYILPDRMASYISQFTSAEAGQSTLIEHQLTPEMWIEVRYTPVIELDQVTGVCFSAVEITERKLVEQQLREFNDQLEQRVKERTQELETANKRLQELDRLKNKFIADVSHELRTPLTVLTTRVYLLERSSPDKFTKHLSGLKAQIQRLTEFAETVLDLSRIDITKDQEKLVFEDVDLNQVVTDMVEAVAPRAEVAGLTLDVHLDPHALMVNGEYNQLAQIATNLLTNAVKYTPEGSITVRTRRDNTKNEAVMSVQDTGMGIAPEDLERLYDRFYRGERAGQSTIPGTGLGLAIVQELVELYNGRIEMESEVNKGSIFYIYLPLIPI